MAMGLMKPVMPYDLRNPHHPGLAAHDAYGCVDRMVPKRPRVSVGGLLLCGAVSKLPMYPKMHICK